MPGQDNGSVATLERNDLSPTCAPGSATIVNDGTAKPLTLSCSDPLGAALQISIVGAPSHGTLSGLNPVTGAVSYQPTTGYAGADSFAFQSTDGSRARTQRRSRSRSRPPCHLWSHHRPSRRPRRPCSAL